MGTTLNKVASDGTVTSIGTIAGTGRCILTNQMGFTDDAGTSHSEVLVITTGASKPYTYDGTTLTLGTDADLPNAATSSYINRRVVYDGSGGDVAFPDLGEPLDQNSLNIIIAEAKPDDTKAVYAYKQQVYCFGESSIQPMYNSGTGNPPYAFILNATQ